MVALHDAPGNGQPQAVAAPVGMQVWAEAEVTAVDGRKLTFAVTAYDETGPIGKGTHERFIIQNDKFLAKAQGKKKGN